MRCCDGRFFLCFSVCRTCLWSSVIRICWTSTIRSDRAARVSWSSACSDAHGSVCVLQMEMIQTQLDSLSWYSLRLPSHDSSGLVVQSSNTRLCVWLSLDSYIWGWSADADVFMNVSLKMLLLWRFSVYIYDLWSFSQGFWREIQDFLRPGKENLRNTNT